MDFEKLPEPEVHPRADRSRGPVIGWLLAVIVVAAGLGAVWWLNRPASRAAAEAPFQAAGDPEEAAQMARRVDDLLEVADEQRAAGRLADAEEALTEAAELQREINGRFAGTKEASAERLHEIEGERQTVLAAPVIAEVARLDAQAADHLRRRELYQAQRIISPAWEKLEAAAVDFPLAHGMDEELRLRLGWLNRRHAELGWMQDLAYEGFVPDPDAPGLARLETGPGWELHKRVMGAGAGSTAAETAEFCRRLGWLLGRPVRPALEGAGATRSAFQVIVEAGAAGN